MLLERAKEDHDVAFNVSVDESRNLIERLKKGELDLIITNDDLGADTLLREAAASSADPIMHTEVVLVGPEKDPLGIHAERNLKNSLRLLLEGEAAFFHCVPCGTRAREEAIFAQLADLPARRGAFVDVGKNEEDIVRAMQTSPGYGFLSRATVMHKVKNKEWSFRPLWSGDALQVDTYRVIVRPAEKIAEANRAPIETLRTFLKSDAAKALIGAQGVAELRQPYFKPGAAAMNEGAKFQ